MKYKIFIVSGGTGRTAKISVKSTLTQFPDKETEIIQFSEIREIDKIKSILNDAKIHDAIIVHTFVEKELNEYIESESRKMGIETIDLMGDMINKFSIKFQEKPLQAPGLYNKINEEYFKRIDAIQYAFKHDDGARIDDINSADIILLGVSRTFKTPLSIYLAYKGYFVINIPIIDGIFPPKEISDVDPNKVFCLTTNANRLSELRKSRSSKLGEYANKYSDIVPVRKELQFAMRYYTIHPDWQIINVTGKSIEEIASQILNLRELSL